MVILRYIVIFLIVGISFPVLAANHYIRPNVTNDVSLGCEFNGNGTTWACAASAGAAGAHNDVPASASLTRGDVYYFSTGTWGTPSVYLFTKAASGTDTITFKKATVADHGGQETGWSAGLGTGQAVFTDWFPDIQTSYWTIDGAAGSGSDHTTYGFEFTRSGADCALGSKNIIDVPSTITNSHPEYITFQYVSFVGCDNVSYPAGCGIAIKSAQDNDAPTYHKRGFKITHCYFDNNFQNTIYLVSHQDSEISNNYFGGNLSFNNALATTTIANGGSGYAEGDTITIYDADCKIVGTTPTVNGATLTVSSVTGGAITGVTRTSGGANYIVANSCDATTLTGGGSGAVINIAAVTNCHGETLNMRGAHSTVIKNNIFKGWMTFSIGMHERDSVETEGSNNDTYIFNNIFDGSTLISNGFTAVVGSVNSGTADTFNRAKVYHNVFLNIPNSGYSRFFDFGAITSADDYGDVQNNLFYNVYLSTNFYYSIGTATHSYNAYLKQTGTNPTEATGQFDSSATTAIFTNYIAGDYSINASSQVAIDHLLGKGYNLPSEFDIDAAGNARSATPTIGAYENAGAPDTTPPTITSATIDATGTVLTITLSEAVKVSTSTGFTLDMNGGAGEGLTYSSGSGSSNLLYTITGRIIQTGETGTLDYVTVADGIEDLSGNDLASTGGSDVAVINNSTYTSSVVSYVVTPLSVGGCTVSPSAPISVATGETTQLTCTAIDNYSCVSWSGTCAAGTGTTTYTTGAIVADCTAIANCIKTKGEISLDSGSYVNIGTGGTIVP